MSPTGDEAGTPPVVGIGASAGGLEAFSELLDALPDDTGMAFVLVQHLNPEHESRLSELLDGHNLMPVTEVEDAERVEPGHVYVIPSDKQLRLEDGRLRLSGHDGGPERGHRHTIDRFFESIAHELGPRAIGVLLSGTLTDGVLGLKEIRTREGAAIVQDPDSARFPDLPQAAINAGAADFVLTPREAGAQLGRLARQPLVRPGGDGDERGWSEETLQQVLRRVAEVTGVDFEHYKESTVKRRIHRRVMATRTQQLEDYRDLLEEDPAEVQALYDQLLILVTEFFRDPEIDEVLAEDVIPGLVEDADEGEPIRVWVPGCSTGQEAYSLAILLQEALDRAGSGASFQLFATDVSKEAVNEAREGLYPASIEAQVSEARLQRFFERAGGGYRIKKSIRSNCIFSVHDVTSDPPFSNIDLVSCRNLIIYLDSVLQRRALGMFHYALEPDGYLVLGTSESPGQASDLFNQTAADATVYEPRAVATNAIHRFTAAPDVPVHRQPIQAQGPEELGSQERRARSDKLLLDRYAPPAVVVNEDLEILEFKGSTDAFLEQPSGQATHHLLKRLRPDLRTAAGQALDRARESDAQLARESAHIEEDGERVSVDVEVQPLQAPQGVGEHFLVVFQTDPESEIDPAESRGLIEAIRDRARDAIEDGGGAKDERIEELEEELAATREYLQSLIEDYEATVEELQSTNEEALSANEELQSTNEELETAKEELQSTNEELMTLNAELGERNEEVQRVNDDLRNLLASVRLPIVMLGPDLQVRRFTPDAGDLLNLRSGDQGRPLTDLQLPVDDAEFEDVVLDVLDNLQVEERGIETNDGDRYRLRVQPYRTSENKVDGVVLVLLSAGSVDAEER